jgi:hypothetical protein
MTALLLAAALATAQLPEAPGALAVRLYESVCLPWTASGELPDNALAAGGALADDAFRARLQLPEPAYRFGDGVAVFVNPRMNTCSIAVVGAEAATVAAATDAFFAGRRYESEAVVPAGGADRLAAVGTNEATAPSFVQRVSAADSVSVTETRAAKSPLGPFVVISVSPLLR